MQDGIRGDVSAGKPVDGGQTAVYGDCPGSNRIKFFKKILPKWNRGIIQAELCRKIFRRFSDT